MTHLFHPALLWLGIITMLVIAAVFLAWTIHHINRSRNAFGIASIVIVIFAVWMSSMMLGTLRLSH